MSTFALAQSYELGTPAIDGSDFVNGWRDLAHEFIRTGGEQPVTGKWKVRLRIKELTGGRCHFVAAGMGATVGLANSIIRTGRMRISVLSWSGDASCETTTWRTKDHHLSLQIPLSQPFEAKVGEHWKTVAPGSALVLSGAGVVQRRWHGESELLNIMIDRETLDQQAMLGASPEVSNDFLPKMVVLDLTKFRMFTKFLTLLLMERSKATSQLQRPDVEYESDRLLLQLLIAALKAGYSGQPIRDRLVIVPRHVRIAERYIREQYPHQISLRQVAEACQISVRTLQSSFRSYRDTTPKEFIRNIRMTHARSLLVSNPGLSIADVANAVGYRSHSQFTGDYKRTFGECPKATRGTRPLVYRRSGIEPAVLSVANSSHASF